MTAAPAPHRVADQHRRTTKVLDQRHHVGRGGGVVVGGKGGVAVAVTTQIHRRHPATGGDQGRAQVTVAAAQITHARNAHHQRTGDGTADVEADPPTGAVQVPGLELKAITHSLNATYDSLRGQGRRRAARPIVFRQCGNWLSDLVLCLGSLAGDRHRSGWESRVGRGATSSDRAAEFCRAARPCSRRPDCGERGRRCTDVRLLRWSRVAWSMAPTKYAGSGRPAQRRVDHRCDLGPAARAGLVELLERAARERDVGTVRATVSPNNIASRELILQYGFTEVGEQWDDEDGLEIIYEVAADRHR